MSGTYSRSKGIAVLNAIAYIVKNYNFVSTYAISFKTWKVLTSVGTWNEWFIH